MPRFSTRREYSEKTAGDGIGLICLEQQQIFALFYGPDRIVHAPAPSHPVKKPGIAGQHHAAGVPTVAHELPRALLAMGRLPGPLGLADLLGRHPQRVGQRPRRQLAGFDVEGEGAPGNVLVNQENPSFPGALLWPGWPEVSLLIALNGGAGLFLPQTGCPS